MLEVGQVLSLKIRFNNYGAVASVAHPILVLDIDKENEWIDDNKKVFMSKEEIISLNEDLK